MKYWKNGFYEIPIEGAVEISDALWRDLLEGQKNGFEIRSNESGEPMLVANIPTENQITKDKINRLKADLDRSDYKVIKCMEMSLVGETIPYDMVELSAERSAYRAEINRLEEMV